MFLSQLALAGVMAVLVLLLDGQSSFTPTVLGPVLALLSLLQCGVGVFLPELVARPGSKGAILAATLLAAVLLASPGWFLMLALITAQRTLPLLVLAFAVALGYALGFLLTGRFGRRASGVVTAH